ncbi:MAG: hypothetical protein HY927_01245 [Elusimicrobia bacterium]|nr:hypothetical protein [Elusimicrobiota bacterium]
MALGAFGWLLVLGAHGVAPAGAAVAGRDSIVLCDDIADPVTLNPHRSFENKSDNIILQMFDGLLRFDRDGGIEPALATECRQLDPLTLRCRIRKGVAFHNGEPLDPETVRWSLSRQIDPKTAHPAAMEFSSIKEIRVVEPDSVDILTSRPDGLLRHRLASFVKILPKGYFTRVGDEGFSRHPVGTGPFRFAGWERGKAIRLEANERYWEPGLPRVKKVAFLFVPEAEQLPGLFGGRLDLVTEIPATRTASVAGNKRTKVSKKLVLATPAFWVTSFAGPLGDPRVRRALNMAVDREQLIRYAVRGNGQSIATLSMRGETGQDPELKPYPYSPNKARELLAQAGHPGGFRLTLLSTEQSAREAKIIAAQWEKIGVRTELTILPLSEVHKIMVGRKKEFDVTANLAPDITAHIYFLAGICFHSKSLFSRMSSPEFDRLYERLLETIDPAEHLRLARRLDAWIYHEAPAVFTYQKIRTFAMNRGLEVPIPVTGMLDLKEAYWR